MMRAYLLIVVMMIMFGGCEIEEVQTSSTSSVESFRLSEESLAYKQIILDNANEQTTYRFYGNGTFLMYAPDPKKSLIGNWVYDANSQKLVLAVVTEGLTLIALEADTLSVGNTVQVKDPKGVKTTQHVISINTFRSNMEDSLALITQQGSATLVDENAIEIADVSLKNSVITVSGSGWDRTYSYYLNGDYTFYEVDNKADTIDSRGTWYFYQSDFNWLVLIGSKETLFVQFESSVLKSGDTIYTFSNGNATAVPLSVTRVDFFEGPKALLLSEANLIGKRLSIVFELYDVVQTYYLKSDYTFLVSSYPNTGSGTWAYDATLNKLSFASDTSTYLLELSFYGLTLKSGDEMVAVESGGTLTGVSDDLNTTLLRIY